MRTQLRRMTRIKDDDDDLSDPYGISPRMISRMLVSLLRMMERTSSDKKFLFTNFCDYISCVHWDNALF